MEKHRHPSRPRRFAAPAGASCHAPKTHARMAGWTRRGARTRAAGGFRGGDTDRRPTRRTAREACPTARFTSAWFVRASRRRARGRGHRGARRARGAGTEPGAFDAACTCACRRPFERQAGVHPAIAADRCTGGGPGRPGCVRCEATGSSLKGDAVPSPRALRLPARPPALSLMSHALGGPPRAAPAAPRAATARAVVTR